MRDENIFRAIFTDLYYFGKECSPRGLKIIEIENFHYKLPPYVRFSSFESRKFNLDYLKREMSWYLKGDKFDISIGEHAKMWKDLVTDSGEIYSNYGQYIFGEQNQFDRVVKTLKEDKESRRATIVILNSKQLSETVKDYPCTYSINFHVRENKLNMIVNMRSQDCYFGMGNDAPCFSIVHEMMFVTLKEEYPELEYGTYFHNADSFHIYERHFESLEKIVNKEDLYQYIDVPHISGKAEVDFLRKLDYSNIPEQYKFTKWLTTYDRDTTQTIVSK